MSRLFGTDGVRGTAGKPPLDEADHRAARRGARARAAASRRGAHPGRTRYARIRRMDRADPGARRHLRRRPARQRRGGADAGGGVSDAVERHVRRRDRDFRVPQSVPGQRDQGVLRPRREVRCRRRGADRSARRRSVVHRRHRHTRDGPPREPASTPILATPARRCPPRRWSRPPCAARASRSTARTAPRPPSRRACSASSGSTSR